MKRTPPKIALLMMSLLAAPVAIRAAETVVVGAKDFTEQTILGELVAQLLEKYTDLQVERRFGLGSGICHEALVAGELDLYVEYTGTALMNVLGESPMRDPDEVFQLVSRRFHERFDLVWLPPIGFNSTYTITVRAEEAERRGWQRISDLVKAAPKLEAVFTSEFMARPDGHPGLRAAYGIEFGIAREAEPDLMCKALAGGQVDVGCVFSADGGITAYDLKVLEDDRSFFPPYDAAPIVRGDVLRRHPEIRIALTPLAGTISVEMMRGMDYAVRYVPEGRRRRPAEVAAAWIDTRATRKTPSFDGDGVGREGFTGFFSQWGGELVGKTLEHLRLTVLAMLIAILVGVPAGIGIHRYRRASASVLAVAEVVQTIPSLAMLAFLFALYRQLGAVPAVTALALYALLPIILNTYTGLKQVTPALVEAAKGLGMSGRQRLFMVEIPLALPVMVAGIRASTVWTVGVATLSTYIGAGGRGDFIRRGLSQNSPKLILLGAVPAALMAVVLSMLIRWVERRLSRHARG